MEMWTTVGILSSYKLIQHVSEEREEERETKMLASMRRPLRSSFLFRGCAIVCRGLALASEKACFGAGIICISLSTDTRSRLFLSYIFWCKVVSGAPRNIFELTSLKRTLIPYSPTSEWDTWVRQRYNGQPTVTSVLVRQGMWRYAPSSTREGVMYSKPSVVSSSLFMTPLQWTVKVRISSLKADS